MSSALWSYVVTEPGEQEKTIDLGMTAAQNPATMSIPGTWYLNLGRSGDERERA